MMPVSTRQYGPNVDGKFLRTPRGRLWVKGVSYGTFTPDPSGRQFPPPKRMAEDFAMMRQSGVNTLRTYTVPDSTLLDLACENGLHVMAGIAWPQHVAFLDDRALRAEIRRTVLRAVRDHAEHPAILAFVLGNEIPVGVVRWHGARAIERFLATLYEDAKMIAPEALFTYVNYPTTEYLEIPFFDVCSFNVYLHRETELRAYLARLQNIAGTKPLLVAEVGADSRRHGEEGQAALTTMAVRAAFIEGACGTVVFSWTDEWWRGGSSVQDWAFGLVDAERRPKPALSAVERVFASVPIHTGADHRPKVSVVVCAYNEAATIDACLTSLEQLTYPDYEIIVINDGSRDATGDVARSHPRARVIDVPNGGLSVARNIGLAASVGDIVAYTDADVQVDPDWLTYLVQALVESPAAVAVGGPNVVPAGDPWLAQCVARAPGGPTQVLLDDRFAEHVPGCNMAFRREALLAAGGFDPVFVRAGDDVDLCWRLQVLGWKIRFAPGALVWHHHRSSVKAYWRQQVGYGEGETWLIPRHPERFAGRAARWRGQVYSPLPYIRSLSSLRVNSGLWGSAPFPSVYRADAPLVGRLPHSASWQCSSLAFLLVGLVLIATGFTWLGVSAAVAGAATLGVTIVKCLCYAWRSNIDSASSTIFRPGLASRLRYRLIIGLLHYIQPLARAYGRVRGLLHPAGAKARPRAWRFAELRSAALRAIPSTLRLLVGMRIHIRFWSESWISTATFLSALSERLRDARIAESVAVDKGWWGDRDISLELGRLARLDLKLLVEEHHGGRCLLVFASRLRPVRASVLVTLGLFLTTMSAVAASPQLRHHALAVASAVACVALATMVWRVTIALAGVRENTTALARELRLHHLEERRQAPGGRTAGGIRFVNVPRVLAGQTLKSMRSRWRQSGHLPAVDGRHRRFDSPEALNRNPGP